MQRAQAAVQVVGVWELVHYHATQVVQQGLLVDRVLYFWDLGQVFELETFHLQIQEEERRFIKTGAEP